MRRRRVLGATYWDLTEAFFEAKREYRLIYMLYETRVLAHAEERGVDRRQLRLDATEVSALLDFDRLAGLRNVALQKTKEISHSLFRSKGRTHKFDRYVSEIYHELSILREEQYKVSTFAEEYRRENELEQYELILDEVHEEFPRRVHHIHETFGRAQRSLEGILRAHKADPTYLRSLYLFGDETLRDAYPDGVGGHAWRVFDGGPIEAFVRAARSFAHRGFKAQALAALDRSLLAAEGDTSYAQADLSPWVVEARNLQAFVSARTPLELVRAPQLQQEVAVPVRGDDAAPDLGEDMGSHDLEELSEYEVRPLLD